MEVTEVVPNPSKLVEEATRGNLPIRNASRKQCLESGRGYSVNAIAGRNPEKLGQTIILAEDHALDQVAEAEEPAMPEQLKTFAEKDVEMQTPKGLFKGSDKQLQAFKLHFDKTLSKSTTVQFKEAVNCLGDIQDEMGGMNAPVVDAMMAVSLDSGNSKDYKEFPPKGMSENSSLQKTVVSLKAELENLKRKHAELKGIAVGAESTTLLHCTPEDESRVAGKNNCRPAYEVAQNKNETKDLNIKAKGHEREHEMLQSYAKALKKPRITRHINEENDCGMSALDLRKSLPERNYYACVSTSESSARIMNHADELESSSQQPKKSENQERENLMVIEGRIESDKHDHASEFSIRDYVFSARNKNISTNWPFSQKNLQLCLKLGVTNVLPPFQPVYLLRDDPVRKCLTEKSVSTEESNLNGRPSVMKKRSLRGKMDRRWNQEFVEGYKDLNTLPSGTEKDLRFQTTAVICQSEVGSVSTSNLPLSEAVSDEQEAAASAANKTKSSLSQTLDKKCRLAMKLPVNSRRGALEDITSACTIPSEAMASKICPVCETFSSSSNTTLNAHIDQCLSSQSSPKWANNSKLTSPRIKPRKIRRMVDICATAPRSTLEDLDRRNGSNWATNLDFSSEDTGLPTEGSDRRECSRYTVNNRNDDSVYIDSNGRKVRILSKFNETAPSSTPKPREDPKVRKQSKRSRSCNFLSASRKRRLMKHLKYLRVTRQRKHYLSQKACVTEDATCAEHTSHTEDQPPGSFTRLKIQERKNHKSSQTLTTCKSSRIISLRTKNGREGITNAGRYDFRPMKDLRVRSDHSATRKKTLITKSSHLSKKRLCSMLRSMRSSVFESAGVEQMSWGSCRKTMGHSPPRSKILGNSETFLRDPDFNEKNTEECVRKSLASGATSISSLERIITIQPDAIRYPEYAVEEMRSCNSESGMLFSNLSYNGERHSGCNLNGSAIDNIYGGNREEESEAWSTDTEQQFSAKQGYSQDGLLDTNGFSKRADGGQGKYDFAISTATRHGNKDFDDPVSSTILAIGEADITLSTCLVPTLQKVADESAPLSKALQGTDRFPSLLFMDESKAYFPQHCVGDEHMLYRDVSAAERSELKMGNADVDFGKGSSLLEIDPILIPGPPGCDLPSFSDMGSEDEGNVGNGDSSETPLSAISTINNLCVSDEQIYRGWSGASSPLDTSTVFSQAGAARTETVASNVNDLEEGSGKGQQCCCSRKEGIPWSAALNCQEPRLQGVRMASSATYTGALCTDSTYTKWPYSLDDAISFSACQRMETENLVHSVQTLDQYIASVNVSTVESHRPSYCDSAGPTPVLRLMGKDLMVLNTEEGDPSLVQATQNVSVNRQDPLVTETSSRHDRIWERPSSQTSALVEPQPYEQEPYFFSGQCFNVGPSTIINSSRSSNYTSGSGFSDVGASPLERGGQ